MKTHIITLALCLTAFAAQSQTEYIVDQPLGGQIKAIEVHEGWNVRLVHDNMNMVSIATPCEYYFTEGNEPEICKLNPDGTLAIRENHSMPVGTVVEVHYSEPIGHLWLFPRATVSADTLLMLNQPKTVYDGEIILRSRAVFSADHIGCNGGLTLSLDSNATAHVGTISDPQHVELSTMKGSTLTVDSLDCPDVRYDRNPKSHGNLTHSDSTRHLTVKNRNRWFADGLQYMRNTIGLEYNVPFANSYNNPYAMPVELVPVIGLHTNTIPMSRRWGLSLGFEFGIPVQFFSNNSTLKGRTLEIDTVSPGVNRRQSMMYMYLGLPTRLHYLPQTEFGKAFFADLHIGLQPRVNFFQRYFNELLTPTGRWESEKNKVGIYNTFQLRAEVGLGFQPFSSIELNFYVDLLPTYRRDTGMGNVHTFGFQVKF